MTSQISFVPRMVPSDGGGLGCEPSIYLPHDRLYEQHSRPKLEQYMFGRFEGHVNIDSYDLSILSLPQLRTLVEVFKDLEHYELAMSMIKLAPSQWDIKSRNAWIHYVSQKYVDNHEVDVSRGECEQFQEELRRYWVEEHKKWCDAADYHEKVIRLRQARNDFAQMQTIVQIMDLSDMHPCRWNGLDRQKFRSWMEGENRMETDSSDDILSINDRLNEWERVCDIMISHRLLSPPRPLTPIVQQAYEDQSLMAIKAVFMQPDNILALRSSPPNTGEFPDPEDWDKETLNRWLETQVRHLGFPSERVYLSERHRRLIMIYVRCAWPHDPEAYAKKGLMKIFPHDNLGEQLYNIILRMRPSPKQQEVNTKTESQRHRNRRDLHLWEFLLILLANQEFEHDSIHWKVQSDGKFELSNRLRVAKMWGLTKGNNKMTYDNMSRSVRQYYKDDDTGIMIRHKPGEPSFGKYSYQFHMKNCEVDKLWNSLMS